MAAVAQVSTYFHLDTPQAGNRGVLLGVHMPVPIRVLIEIAILGRKRDSAGYDFSQLGLTKLRSPTQLLDFQGTLSRESDQLAQSDQ
jgi:hypothetical protein